MASTGAAASGSPARAAASGSPSRAAVSTVVGAGSGASPSLARPTVAGAAASRSLAQAMESAASRLRALPVASIVAGASRSPSGWAVLDRVAEFVNPSDLPGALEYAVALAAPPVLSSLRIARDIPDDREARVECADADGNLVISIRSDTGARALLVCRAETGRVELLPPVDHPGFASTGILPQAAPPGFVVVQLFPAAASYLALCYSSSSRCWTSNSVTDKQAQATLEDSGWLMVEEVRGQQEGEAFHPDTVVAHEDGMHLAFVDIKSGALLLFDVMSPSSARLLPLPDYGVMMEPDVKEASLRRLQPGGDLFPRHEPGRLRILMEARRSGAVDSQVPDPN